MVYFYTILKIYIDLIQNQRKSSIDLSIQPSSMQNSKLDHLFEFEKTPESFETDENCGDVFTDAQLEELEMDNFLMKELDATLEFKEKLEEYVYDNFLPFLKYFNMKRLRNMFMFR